MYLSELEIWTNKCENLRELRAANVLRKRLIEIQVGAILVLIRPRRQHVGQSLG